MQFGKQKTTILLNEEGATRTTEKNIVNGRVNKPVRQYYEFPERVTSQKEEHAAYIAFSDELKRDPTMLDPLFRIEHSKIGNENGYYYVVKCYTKLEY